MGVAVSISSTEAAQKAVWETALAGEVPLISSLLIWFPQNEYTAQKMSTIAAFNFL